MCAFDWVGQTWEKTFGGTSDDLGVSVQQTTDGGYVIAGWTEWTESSGDGGDVYLIKTDDNGDSLWTKTFGDTSSDFAYSVQQTTDGGYVIAGTTLSFGNGGDVYLIKTDGNGDSLWTKTFRRVAQNDGYSVQQTTDGGYVITGLTMSAGNGGDVWLIKTDGNGDSLWTKTFGGTNLDLGHSVQQTTDGGYVIAGATASFGNAWDVYLIKTDGNGDSLWTKTLGDTSSDFAYSVQQTNDGGYIITGATVIPTDSYGNGISDVYLIKTDGNGNVTAEFTIPMPSTNRKLEKVVDILGRDINPEKNKPFIEIYNDGTVEKKMIIE